MSSCAPRLRVVAAVALIGALAACSRPSVEPSDDAGASPSDAGIDPLTAACTAVPQATFDDAGPSGIARCDETTFVRTGPPSCSLAVAAPGDGWCAVDQICRAHDECGADALCVVTDGLQMQCGCAATCVEDGDCAVDEACFCAATTIVRTLRPRCVPATCRSAADCGGRHCGVVLNACGAVEGLACRTDDDACEGADDCTGACGPEMPCACRYDDDATRWRCDVVIPCVE